MPLTPSRTRRVVLTDHSYPDLDRESAAAAGAGAEFVVAQCSTADEVSTATRGADVVLVNLAPVTRDALAGLAPGASVIRYGVGYDNVDVDAAADLGVAVANVPDYGVDTVADHAAALLLALVRDIRDVDAATRSGWPSSSVFPPPRGLRSLTVGLVGTGRIGTALADRLRAFGIPLIAHDPYVPDQLLAERGIERVALPELLRRARAVSLHLPLTDATRGLIDEAALAALPPGSFVVNTARGGLIDERALVAALESGHLGGAALDVFQEEPLPNDSPLRSAPRLLLSPHFGFFSDESMARLQECVAEELARALAGEPLAGLVTPELAG